MDALKRFYAEHPALYELTKNDATVYAWFKQCEMGRCTIEEALIGVVVGMAGEKRRFFEELVKYNMAYGSLNAGGSIQTVQCPACPAVARGYGALVAHMEANHPNGYLS